MWAHEFCDVLKSNGLYKQELQKIFVLQVAPVKTKQKLGGSRIHENDILETEGVQRD